MSFKPQQIFVENSVAQYRMTQTILDHLPGVPVRIVPSSEEAIAEVHQSDDPPTEGKRYLLIARQKGKFLKPCPGTSNYICCGYQILNVGTNCDIDCTYCILQGYLNNPLMTVYVNIDDLFSELDETLARQRRRFYRIGTGELTDSLCLDHLTAYSRFLIPYFARQPNAILELKTKTTIIDNLFDLDHNGRAVISWSVNSARVIASEEALAPSLTERLEAARKCQAIGYKIGFHFDPLIYYDGWQEEYKEVVDRIFAAVRPENIIWISLGALRYSPQLDGIIRQRHPHSEIVHGELFPGKDGKLRYFKPIRIEMFRQMYDWIKAHSDSVFVYLCMESAEVWQKAFGWAPKNNRDLSQMLDKKVR